MRKKYLKWLLICLLVGLLSGGAGYYYMRPHLPEKILFDTKPDKEENQEMTLFPFKDWNERNRKRPLAIVLDNVPEARPQSGLEEADVVVEVPVEGGVTRLLAMLSGDNVETVGPIRSARPYLLDLALEYNSILVHAGGSQNTIELIELIKPEHLDEISGGPLVGAAFWRVPDRPKPHNLYASQDSLRRAAERLQYKMGTGLPQRTTMLPDKEIPGIKAEDISIFYNNKFSQVRYFYDKELFVYKRFMSEEPHLSAKGEQLMTANIIVQYVSYRCLDGDGHLQLILHGSGEALVFRAGKVSKAIWEKEPGGFTKYKDTQGNIITMIEGPVWIQIVPKGTRIDY